MANLNLSQFGENTSVSNADYTFVWDSAASISKKVSRNSWLNSGTLTSDAPVTISQTWNAVGQTFKALVVNAAGTSDANSASGSKLLELQVGGAPVFSVSKGGGLRIPIGQFLSGYGIGWVNSGFYATNNNNIFGVSNNQAIVEFKPEGFQISSALSVSWGSIGSPSDTILLRDGAANTLALRNGAAAQTFNVYGTYTSASVYERMFMRYNGTDLAFQVGAETLGATARPLQLWTGGASRLHITAAGNVGIGTTAPSEKLHVLGGKILVGDPTDITGASVNGELTVQAWRTPQLNLVANAASNNFFGLSLKIGTGERAGFLVNMQSGEVKIGGTGGGGYFPTFYSNGSEVMRFSTGGNVGIGTTSPTFKLSVQGDTECRGRLYVTQSTPTTALVFDSSTNFHRIYAEASQHIVFQTGVVGNVGIGTTSPTSKLHVVGDARITTDVFASAVYGFAGANTTCGINGSDGVGPIIHANQNGKIGFFSGTSFSGVMDTVLVRDGEADHLAMRRSTNGQTFSVYGTYPGAAWERFTITAPTSGNVLLGTYKGTGGIARGLEFQTDGVTRMRIDSGGLITFISALGTFSASGNSTFQNIFLADSAVYGYANNLGTGIKFASDGVGQLRDNAGTSFNRLQFGGTTDSFPAIARDGAGIKFTGASAGSTSWVKVPPVAVTALPDATVAGVGARAFVNDALAPTFGSAVTGGGSVPVPVYSTGSAWNVG